MEYSRELLFFFSALGAFNGVLMGLYFIFFARPKHISNYFLGGFLLMLSIRIGKSVFFYFNPDLAFSYLQFGLTGCLFIGPFLFFYVKSIVSPNSGIERTWKYHIAVLFPIIMFINFMYPFEHHVELWRPYILRGIYYTWLAYTLLAAYNLRSVFKRLFTKELSTRRVDIWLLSIFIGNCAIWFAYNFAGLTSYILGALLFSFMLYILILFLIFNRKKDFVETKTTESYKDKKIDDSIAKVLVNNLTSMMEDERLYTNPNLKIQDVADRLKISKHTLSQLLNDNLGKGFPQFLNEYRINESKKLMLTKPELTLESIGYDCGFNSKSTFYATFKKVTNTTPAKYQKIQLDSKVVRS